MLGQRQKRQNLAFREFRIRWWYMPLGGEGGSGGQFWQHETLSQNKNKTKQQQKNLNQPTKIPKIRKYRHFWVSGDLEETSFPY